MYVEDLPWNLWGVKTFVQEDFKWQLLILLINNDNKTIFSIELEQERSRQSEQRLYSNSNNDVFFISVQEFVKLSLLFQHHGQRQNLINTHRMDACADMLMNEFIIHKTTESQTLVWSW